MKLYRSQKNEIYNNIIALFKGSWSIPFEIFPEFIDFGRKEVINERTRRASSNSIVVFR